MSPAEHTRADRDGDRRLGAQVARGLGRRCPLCGAAGIFHSWFVLEERCQRCAYPFAREHGYWVGAMIVNTALAQLAFGVLLVGGMALFWPEVPWAALVVLGGLVMVGLPTLCYPASKTLWMALDVLFNPPEQPAGGPADGEQATFAAGTGQGIKGAS